MSILALLALEDGSLFRGRSIGAAGQSVGEVVFNTAMTGYQEILTDREGRLWIEGRLVHVIRTAAGPVTPVPIEQAVLGVDGVSLAAAVGVGPAGAQQVVVVVAQPGVAKADLASLELSDRIRDALAIDVAAVLSVPELPVDQRHNSKIDRSRIAEWAEGVLSGGRMRRL